VLASLTARLDEADAGLAVARAAAEEARRARAAADRDATTAADAETKARRSFDATRDAVAALEPPPAARADLAADWAALAAWAEAERPRYAVEQQSQRAPSSTTARSQRRSGG
jgi:hypothetical protein